MRLKVSEGKKQGKDGCEQGKESKGLITVRFPVEAEGNFSVAMLDCMMEIRGEISAQQ